LYGTLEKDLMKV